MIQKLEQYVIGANYGCGGASFSEVIDKINEVIDFINSRPEEGSGKMTDQEIDKWVEEHVVVPDDVSEQRSQSTMILSLQLHNGASSWPRNSTS